ncbi:MAG TPA: MFS transporter [Candidatus Limnocylindrales bacterium]|nr:MFS transporter [Candidatus Limnocylindrales bacterium]
MSAQIPTADEPPVAARNGSPRDEDDGAGDRNRGELDPGDGPQLRTALWRDRSFVAVWSASTVSLFGSLITRTALPFAAILVLQAGPVEISAIRSAELIAGLVVGLFAGALVDRVRRKPILIWADLGRAVLLGSIPVGAIFGFLSLFQLVLVAFGAAVLTTFFEVADHAFLPTVVSRRRLVAANSVITATGSVAEFSAFGIGGFLIQAFTAPIAIAIDAVSFVVSAILLGTIRKPEPPPKPHIDREPVLREIREGIRIVFHSPLLRALALSHGGTHILWGIFGTSYLLYATEELHLSPALIGVIAAIGGIGSLAGSALAPVMVRRIGVGWSIVAGILGFTIGNTLIPLAPSTGAIAGVSLGALFLIAQQLIGDSLATVYEITETSLVQASVTDRVLGRVNASMSTFTTLLTLAGAIAGGFIAETFGLRTAFWVGLSGAAFTLVAVWFSPVRHVREAPLLPTIDLPGDTLTITE